MKHLLSIQDMSTKEIENLLSLAKQIKKSPQKYELSLKNKTLLMIFAKPSLRTRLSFEAGMTQLGGHAIFYDLADSVMGKKESIADTARTASRYVNFIAARLYEHSEIEELAKYSDVPVINMLTNLEHPCQILADLQTIQEKFKKLKGLKLAYVGDANNNVTHSLMLACTKLGMMISIGCPKTMQPDPKVIAIARKQGNIEITSYAKKAVESADIIYTDSWMSYHVAENQKEQRIKVLQAYQVNKKLMSYANKNAIFMHCLPAQRGYEVTDEVIDSKQSIVFDQAENRLHAQKALLVILNKKEGKR